MQSFECGSPEWTTPLFVSLADNPDALGMPINIPNLQLHCLTDPCPGVVKEQ
ncbi:hypothetical protein MELB17_10913 [Marinobacter sp. ELB17]|nr:hypothetical protein MELB17_10913 [Marinobacter sp. ELB17]